MRRHFEGQGSRGDRGSVEERLKRGEPGACRMLPGGRPSSRVTLPLVVVMAAAASLVPSGCQGGLDGGGDDTDPGRIVTLSGPEVRIGAVDDPDYAFGTVVDLAVGPDGRIHTLHRGDPHVRIWTPMGEPAGILGGEGQGPGEFTRPGRLGFFGDSLWVMDTYAYRVSYFDPSGAFLGRVVPELDLGGADDAEWSPPRPEAPLRDGTFISRSPGWSDAIARGELTKAPVVHMDGRGGTMSEIWVKEVRPQDVLAIFDEDGPGAFFMAQPFADDALSAIVEDGLVVVDRRAWDGEGPPTARVTRLGLVGDTTWTTVVPYAPEALAGERIDSVVSEMGGRSFDFMSRARADLSRAAWERDIAEEIYVPAWTPPFRSVVAAEDGSIWLERFEPVVAEDGSTVRVWSVMSPRGAVEATAYTPDGLRVLLVREDVVWGVETDDLGVDYIVRYRLVEGGGA